MAFAPDGRTLASGSLDETLKLWEASSGRLLRSIEGHTKAVWSVAFAPDGRTFASGSADNTVMLSDAASGRLCHSLGGHQRGIGSVPFAPDGRTLASASEDNTIKLWDVATGDLLLTLLAMPAGGAIAILPDGRFDGDPTALPQVRIGHGLTFYHWEAFPELRSPDAVRAALARFR